MDSVFWLSDTSGGQVIAVTVTLADLHSAYSRQLRDAQCRKNAQETPLKLGVGGSWYVDRGLLLQHSETGDIVVQARQ